MEGCYAFHVLAEELKYSLNGPLTGNTHNLLPSSKGYIPFLQQGK